MATDITRAMATNATRITGPLSASPLFSQMVSVIRDTQIERVHVPGIVAATADPEFVAGVYWGRSAYFDAVDEIVDQAGNPVESLTLADVEMGRVRTVAVHQVTADEVIDLVCGERDEEVEPEFHAGFVVGFIQAASDRFFRLACENCGRHQWFCDCVK